MVCGMELVIGLLAGLVLGAAVAALVVRQIGAVRAAGIAAERDLLRERVVDLEAALSDDAQTAAALAPLRDALGRIEQQVGTLERDRTHQFAALERTIAQCRPRPCRSTARRRASPAPSTPRPCAARGARCSCAACSSTPACWPGATSTSRYAA